MSLSAWQVAFYRCWPALLALASPLNSVPQTLVLRTTTTLQSIAVQVTDKDGNFLKGLPASAFELLEDGKPQTIAFFEPAYQPLSLAVLMDESRTMDYEGKLARARTLLASLLLGHRQNDQIFFMPFTDEAGPFEELTGLQRLHLPPINPPGHRGSAIYDALAAALCHMRNAANVRQAVIVISDGVDQHSRLKLQQLLELVRSSNPQVFMIGLYNSTEQRIFHQEHNTVTLVGLRQIDNPLVVFKRLADESGAEAFFPSSEKEFKKALDRISELLNAQYTLAYYPQSVEGMRKLSVRLKQHHGLKVYTRQTVGPQLAATVVRFTVTGCEVSAKEHPYPWESKITSKPGSPTAYQDDFSDPQSGWPNRHESQRNAHYLRDGGYQLSRNVCPAPAPSAAGSGEVVFDSDCLISAYGPWWHNFRATATIDEAWKSRCPNAGEQAIGLLFHVMEQGYYGLLLGRQKSRPSFALVRGVWNGAQFPLVPWTPLPFLDDHNDHKLAVEYRSPTIKISIDGRLVGNAKDKSFQAGLIGFGVFDKASLTIHSLTVEALPPRDESGPGLQ